MEPSLGWTLLSRDALRRAETQLRDDVEGVRDEVGFLALHQAYADRFFPGTSVLHTRLRYVLFVPWMYERVAMHSPRDRVVEQLQKEELELTRRLRHLGAKHGVIGFRNYPKPTAQPPSMIYWSALSAWRILKPLASGAAPSRQTVHRAIARRGPRHQLHDDDKQLLVEEEPLFGSLPRPPDEWHSAKEPLDFELQPAERRFLRNCFLTVSHPNSTSTLSLLARLVEHQVQLSNRDTLWSKKVVKVADAPDSAALTRARQAAALSAIGRGVYAAMVEEMRERHDGLATEDKHRGNLVAVCDTHSKAAMALNVDEIVIDAPKMPEGIVEVLRRTQEWLAGNRLDVMALHDIYERAEYRRKGRRARLIKSVAGREKRAEWTPTDSAAAEPLHYRWQQVRQLLMDLQGAHE
ncbi:MAG: DUF6361 family protein [Candidatus Paceibacterota bacterium]